VILQLRIGSWKFTFTFAQVTEVVGVNSLLPDGKHILMWDFDEWTFPQVREELERVQRVYELPNIYIVYTGKPKGYHAYCFKKVDWRKALEIITFTRGVDMGFIKYAVIRGHFTLRVSPKCGRKPKCVWILKSDVPEEVLLHELRSWVKYETLADGQEVKLHKMEVK